MSMQFHEEARSGLFSSAISSFSVFTILPGSLFISKSYFPFITSAERRAVRLAGGKSYFYHDAAKPDWCVYRPQEGSENFNNA